MIKEVTMYTVICDNCGADVCENMEYSCWNDESSAKDIAIDSGWLIDDGNHYCDYCFSYDDNDTLVIDGSRTKPTS